MFVNERAVRTFERYKRNIREICTFVAFAVLLLRLHTFTCVYMRWLALTCVDLRLHTFIANDLRLLRLSRMGSNAAIRAFYWTHVHLRLPALYHVLFENVTKNRFFADERDKFAVILNILKFQNLRRVGPTFTAFSCVCCVCCVLLRCTRVQLRSVTFSCVFWTQPNAGPRTRSVTAP